MATPDAHGYYQRMRHKPKPQPAVLPKPADFPVLPQAVINAMQPGGRGPGGKGRTTAPDGRLDQALIDEIADGLKLANNDQVNALAREVRHWRSINEGTAA